MYIPIILGTARKGRQSEKVAKFLLGEAIKAGLETKIIDVAEFLVSLTDNTKQSLQAKKLAREINLADGLIIIAPEYNHGYPGELKLMLDMLYEEYAKKPVGICGVSAGLLGGARMVEQLRLVVIELRMIPIREALYFSDIYNLFDKNGEIQDKLYYKRTKVFLDELIWHSKALKTAREKFK